MMNHHWSARLYAITLIALVILVFANTGQATPGSTIQTIGSANWQVECVDCPRQFSFNAMRLDSNDLPHIAYGGPHLYYASYDGASWQIETLDSAAGMYPSLVLDGLNHPHIGYIDAQTLKYGWYDGTQWHHEAVDSAGLGDTSIVLDSAGHPHLSYFSGNYLRYTWHDGAQWHYQNVDTRDSVASASENSASLALDGMNRPHIAYYDNINDDLKYAWYDGLTWNIETVDSQGWVGNSVSLALDQTDRPHISYLDGSNLDLKYASYDGLVWHIEAVDAVGTVGGYSSLGLDAVDQPHISYQDWSNHRLKHARHTQAGWQTETVDDADAAGNYMYSSIVLDKVGEPHISYYNGNQNTLQYAQHTMGVWHIESVDTSRVAGAYTSMALDKAGRPHISYGEYNKADGTLKYAEYSGTSWEVVTVDTQLGGQTSLKLDQADHPHIGYTTYDGYVIRLKHAWRDDAGWHAENIDTAAETGVSLALNKLGQPRISYRGGSGLNYAWHDGTVWHSETVDDAIVGTGGHSSLALDTADHPHISYCRYVPVCTPRYCNYFCAELKYAWSDETAWHTEALLVGQGDYASSLALDGANRPHIVYTFWSMQYMWHDGSTWHFETIDPNAYCYDQGLCFSLTLDKEDQPRLAYSLGTWLKYAWRGDAGWQTEVIDSSLGGWGAHVSLALDQLGFARIGYNGNSTLKYARQLPALDLEKQATPDRELHSGDTLTYTLTLTGPSLNVNLVDPLPTIVSYVPGSLTETITPSAIYSPAIHSILWQGTLPTDTAQTIRFQVISGMANTGTLVLSPPIVNTAWLTDTDNTRGLLATVIVNGTYFYLPIITRKGGG